MYDAKSNGHGQCQYMYMYKLPCEVVDQMNELFLTTWLFVAPTLMWADKLYIVHTSIIMYYQLTRRTISQYWGQGSERDDERICTRDRDHRVHAHVTMPAL